MPDLPPHQCAQQILCMEEKGALDCAFLTVPWQAGPWENAKQSTAHLVTQEDFSGSASRRTPMAQNHVQFFLHFPVWKM